MALTRIRRGFKSSSHERAKLRTTRRVSVTADGSAYYEKAVRLLKELDDVDTSFGTAQSKPRGLLHIECGSSLANLVIIPALPEFLEHYPDIKIDLGVSDRHADLIGENIDCVIRGGALTDLSLVARQIGAASWVTCATPAYLEQHGVPQHPRELERNHVVVSYLSARSGRVMPMSFARGAEKLEITGRRTVGVNESNAHLAAGLAGLGIIHTFAYTAQTHIGSGHLVSILEDWRPAPYPFHVVYPPSRHLSNRLRVFIDWIAERFATLAY